MNKIQITFSLKYGHFKWSGKHDELVKKTINTSGKPMGFKSPDSVIQHLESLGKTVNE